MPHRFRTLWLSDIHLGTSACRATDLLNFLDDVRADTIYLTGDIVDLERIKQSPRFPESHRQLVGRFIELANTCSKIVYIPGNHDDDCRELVGRAICGIPVVLEAIHETRSGLRLLITHGDVLDAEIRKNTCLQRFGAKAYRLLMEMDVVVNQLRGKLGLEYCPISARIKNRISSANEYIRRFEETAAGYAQRRGLDGIVCGHIHRPAMRNIHNICYANDGDRVEHRTAIAETEEGTLQLLQWHTDAVLVQSAVTAAPMAA